MGKAATGVTGTDDVIAMAMGAMIYTICTADGVMCSEFLKNKGKNLTVIPEPIATTKSDANKTYGM